MPTFKHKLRLDFAGDLAVILLLEAGLVRGHEHKTAAAGGDRVRRLRGRVERLRRKNKSQQRQIARLRRRKATRKSGAGADASARNALLQERYGRVRGDKLGLVDYAFRRLGCRSFADLGGIGAVDGGYTFYTLDEHRPERGVLADVKAGLVRERASRYPNLELVEGDFAEEATIGRVGKVDCLYFFAVLLHQAAPEWDEVLEMWAETGAEVFLVHNPQWTGGEDSVRLLDLGENGYRTNAPPAHEHLLEAAYEMPDEVWEGEGRRYRDLRHFWQWGITDEDLIKKMKALGFKLRYLEDRGPFDSLPNLENRAFVFSR